MREGSTLILKDQMKKPYTAKKNNQPASVDFQHLIIFCNLFINDNLLFGLRSFNNKYHKLSTDNKDNNNIMKSASEEVAGIVYIARDQGIKKPQISIL